MVVPALRSEARKRLSERKDGWRRSSLRLESHEGSRVESSRESRSRCSDVSVEAHLALSKGRELELESESED